MKKHKAEVVEEEDTYGIYWHEGKKLKVVILDKKDLKSEKISDLK